MKRNLLISGFVLALAAVPAWSQAAGGMAGISGEVRDASGSVVPKAKIVISSELRGSVRTLETNGAGIFAAPGLVPDTAYRITVTAPGFAIYEAKDIDLQVGQSLNLAISLSVGQTTTSVDVTAAAQLLNDTKTDVSQVVEQRAKSWTCRSTDAASTRSC